MDSYDIFQSSIICTIRWSCFSVFQRQNPNHQQNWQPLQEVRSRYIGMGQSSNTLSGWEAQRVKLASFLGKRRTKSGDHILFISTNLRNGPPLFTISKRLLHSTMPWTSIRGHFVIYHRATILRWIKMPQIGWLTWDPEGGNRGGHLTFAGTPRGLGQRAGELYREVLREIFGEFEQHLQGFQNRWRVIIIPIGASLRT